MKRVRWGIVGAGRIAQVFARDIAFVDNATLDAVAAREHASAEAFRREYGIARAHGGYDRLFADPDIDAVYIATPHNLHAPQARAAIDAGKAVLCEKPLTDTPEACRELIDHAAAERVYLMEAMWTWFLPAIRKAQEWVASGRIGNVLHVRADFGYPFPYDPDRREYDRDLAGGCLLEMGIYPVAFADLFLRGEPDAMHVVAHFAPNGVEDDVAMLFAHGDRTVSLSTSYRCKPGNAGCVIGDAGYIVVPDFFRARECTLYRVDERIEHFEERREGEGYTHEIAAASADILAGRLESAIVPLNASLRFQERMAAVRTRFPADRP